jgi:dCTP deaminase
MSGKLIKEDIISRIKKQKLVENYDLQDCVKIISYELRVGSYYDSQMDRRIDLVRGEEIAVRPHSFLLLGTVERVNLPNDIMGMMYLWSSFARHGFVPYFQGIVDPGYKGNLTLMLHNLSGELVSIKGEESICHLVFEQLSQPVDKGYEGAYQDSKGASPSQYVSTVKIVGETMWPIPE